MSDKIRRDPHNLCKKAEQLSSFCCLLGLKISLSTEFTVENERVKSGNVNKLTGTGLSVTLLILG